MFHILVDGAALCASQIRGGVACQYRLASEAERCSHGISLRHPQVTVEVVPGRCPCKLDAEMKIIEAATRTQGVRARVCCIGASCSLDTAHKQALHAQGAMGRLEWPLMPEDARKAIANAREAITLLNAALEVMGLETEGEE